MAKYTLAEVCEKLLAVRSGLDAGRTTGVACKAAGLSPGTYKKWLASYAHLDLPRWVVEAPHRGALALSGDGRHVFTVADEPGGLLCVRRDATSGAESARLFHPAPRDGGVWREVIAAAADEEGTRLRAVVSGGTMFTWNVARSELSPVAHDLRTGCVELGGRASSGARRWAFASISPDLARVACWETLGDRDTRAPARVVVRAIDDGAVVLRHETPAQFIGSALVFHPTRPLLAFLDDDKLVTVLDLDARRPLVERGPQVHSASFGPNATLVYDDWYSRTQVLDLATGESRVLRQGWGSLASLRDRFVNVSETSVLVRSARDPGAERKLTLEKIVEVQLSRDGACLAVLADRLCVWDLGPSEG